MPGTLDHPFGNGDVVHIHLPHAPLVKVLAQVRFSAVASIARPEFVGPFQEALRHRYPVMTRELETAVLLTPEGLQNVPGGGHVWRLSERPGPFRVSLGTGFMALEAVGYTNHEDFFGRLDEALSALAEHVRPADCMRLGVRYIDRLIEASDLAALNNLVRSEVAGVSADPDITAILRHNITQAEVVRPEGVLAARWGLLPAGVTLEPTLDAADAVSWILDLDMYRESDERFEVTAIGRQARTFANAIYEFFRWVVTPAFLQRFGASEEELQAAGVLS